MILKIKKKRGVLFIREILRMICADQINVNKAHRKNPLNRSLLCREGNSDRRPAGRGVQWLDLLKDILLWMATARPNLLFL